MSCGEEGESFVVSVLFGMNRASSCKTHAGYLCYSYVTGVVNIGTDGSPAEIERLHGMIIRP